MIYIYILLSVFAVSLISLIGITTLSIKKHFLEKILFVFVGLAAGALFGDAILHLIPEAYQNISNPTSVSLFILSGILIFFAFEKFLRWHHSHSVEDIENIETIISHHEEHKESEKIKPLGLMVLASDSLHNFIDGVIIAASFLISVEVGIATTIAVALHEIPQEITDFGLLVHSGMKTSQAMFWNFATALFAVVGALFTIFIGQVLENYVFHLGAITAGAFIYIAGSDLVPEIQKTHDFKKSLIQFLSIIIGILIMLLL